MPPSAPVTSATVLAEAFQSAEIAAHRLVAARGAGGGSGMKASAAQHARHTAPSTAADIQGGVKCSAIHSPAPPPSPVPPRLPAWNQPPARPLSASWVPYAIRLSTDIARNVVARLAPNATALSSGSDF